MSCHLVTEQMSSQNRNPIQNWAITFPQSGDVEKKDFLHNFPPHKRAICCKELHADGRPHLHMGISLIKPLTKTQMLKWIETKYPNDNQRIEAKATRNLDAWENYVRKEDADVYVSIGGKKFKDPLEEINLTAKFDIWYQKQRAIEEQVKMEGEIYRAEENRRFALKHKRWTQSKLCWDDFVIYDAEQQEVLYQAWKHAGSDPNTFIAYMDGMSSKSS